MRKGGGCRLAVVPNERDPASRLQDAEELFFRLCAVEPVERLACCDEVDAVVWQDCIFRRGRNACEAGVLSKEPLARRSHLPVRLDPEDAASKL